MNSLPANSGPATAPAQIIRTGNPSLQLSFSCDFSVLWAQNYENNQWSTVDVGEFWGSERTFDGKKKLIQPRLYFFFPLVLSLTFFS